MLTNDLVPCFVQSFNTDSKTGYEKALLVGVFDKTTTDLDCCNAAYFCKGWENARGCRIEHDAAVAYGLEVLYED